MKDVGKMTAQELWDGGYSVAIFTPDELRGASPDQVSEIMIERGWNAIDTLATE